MQLRCLSCFICRISIELKLHAGGWFENDVTVMGEDSRKHYVLQVCFLSPKNKKLILKTKTNLTEKLLKIHCKKEMKKSIKFTHHIRLLLYWIKLGADWGSPSLAHSYISTNLNTN